MKRIVIPPLLIAGLVAVVCFGQTPVNTPPKIGPFTFTPPPDVPVVKRPEKEPGLHSSETLPFLTDEWQ